MFHPIHDDLSDLKDKELDDKILELTKKYWAAARLGNPDLLTQLETFLIMYKEEQRARFHKKVNGPDNDLGQLINVD